MFIIHYYFKLNSLASDVLQVVILKDS